VKPFRGADAARVRYLQIDECARLLNACEPDFRRIVRGALVTGARYRELCLADVRDFNPDSASLLVRESKGGKPRWIPLDDEAADFLAGITAGRSPSEPLFTRADGGRWGKSHQRQPLLEGAQGCADRARDRVPHPAPHLGVAQNHGRPAAHVAAQVLGHSDTRMVEKHYGAQSFIREPVRATALDLGPIEGKVTALRPGS
jgi:integrase